MSVYSVVKRLQHFHYADTVNCFFFNDKWKTFIELHVMSWLQDSPDNGYKPLVLNMTPLKNLLKWMIQPS